ncbi:MAG: M20 family metallopeptidase [Candidatus Omnitrophica bacterium]|nr:M20 family metallopeptidase [Candidatus Omnitrophota bacterium]
MINKSRLVKLTQKVLSINSENLPGNELKLARFIEKDMRSLGLHVKTHTFKKNRPNIIATLKGALPRAKAAKKAILLTPHFDTVPVGENWRYDPWGSQIIKGKLYGRGATDDKGNLACCLELMRSLVEDGVQLERDIIMAATVDEETGSHAGIIPLLDKKILKPDVALILDSDEFDMIIAQKGLIHCRIQIFGKKAHGAYNWRGENAIEVAARVISKLKRYKPKFQKHAILRPPTMNVGMIKGGDKVNMVADFCEFALDVRFLPGMKAPLLLKEIKGIIRSEAKRFKVEIDDLQQPYEIDKKHPFVQSYYQAAKKMKINATLKGSEGATVITFFKKHKIPAFATGFGAHGTAHTTDEYVHVNTLYKGTQLLEKFVQEYDNL